MREGVLIRDLLWATPSGKHAHVRSIRLVSFEHRHVMAVSYEVTIDRAAPLVLRSRVLNRANAGRDGATLAGPVNDPRIARRLGRRILEPRLVTEDGERLVFGCLRMTDLRLYSSAATARIIEV
jgi:alpha,alpha-trehalose phosphorylase